MWVVLDGPRVATSNSSIAEFDAKNEMHCLIGFKHRNFWIAVI